MDVMAILSIIVAMLGLNVLVNVGVWFRLGNLTARVEDAERRVVRLEKAMV